MTTLMTLAACLLLAGGLGFLSLLFASGGWQRSRQRLVLRQLWSGAMGTPKRRMCQAALAVTAAGAILSFAGVASMDAERAARCHDHCLAAGYSEGRIGPSLDRTPANRFVACVCSADDRPPLELRADALTP